jgi:hypothetical protein
LVFRIRNSDDKQQQCIFHVFRVGSDAAGERAAAGDGAVS